MKKIVLGIFFIQALSLVAQKTVQVGNKKIDLPGESIYGCFAMEFVENKPVAYELHFYLDIQGDKLSLYESWEDVKGPAKATIYTYSISKMDLRQEMVKITPVDKKDTVKGGWDLSIPCVNSEMAVSYKQYFKSEGPKSGKLNILKISVADRQKANELYSQLLTIQKK